MLCGRPLALYPSPRPGIRTLRLCLQPDMLALRTRRVKYSRLSSHQVRLAPGCLNFLGRGWLTGRSQAQG